MPISIRRWVGSSRSYLNRQGALLDYIIFFAVLCLIYGVVLAIPFAQNDDYYYFAYDNHMLFGRHPQFVFFNLVGRQLYNLIAYPMGMMIHDISDFSLVRLLILGIHAVSMTLISRYMITLGVPRLISMLAAVAIFILPGIQVGVLWVTMAPFAVALLLALISGISVMKINAEHLTITNFWHRKNLSMFLVPGLLLFVSLFIYQPWAMFFLLPIVACLLFADGAAKNTQKKILVAGLLFVLVIAGYFIFQHWIFLPISFYLSPEYAKGFQALGQFKFEVSSDPFSRFISLMPVIYQKGFSLWDIYSGGRVVFWVTLTIVTGGALHLLNLAREQKYQSMIKIFISSGVLRLVFLLGLFAASIIPVVASAAGHSGYRVILVFSSMVVLLLWWAILSILKMILSKRETLIGGACMVVLFLVVAGASISAIHNDRDSALNNYRELDYIRAKISEHLHNYGKISRVHFIVPAYGESYMGLPTLGNGEFNYNSASNWPNLPWMFRCALLGFFPERSKVHVKWGDNSNPDTIQFGNDITVTYSTSEKNIRENADAGMLLLDMNKLLKPKYGYAALGAASRLSASRTSGTHGIDRVFDGKTTPDSFWEVGGPFPVEFVWSMNASRIMTKYSISSGETGVRMPMAWQVYGLKKDSAWKLIDTRNMSKVWGKNESRQFIIHNPDSFSSYRFVFNAGFDPNILRIYEIKPVFQLAKEVR